jgi:transposase-like protein
MSPPIPRAARSPLTAKQPDACPRCGGRNLTRRGTRRKKLEIVQLWRCTSCKRTFTPGPAALRNKTYPLRMILSALTDYNLGYTLEETAARLKKKTNRRVSASTVSTWLDDYKQHCSYRRLRRAGLGRFPANQTIRSMKLYHRQVYGYAYHRPKLDFLRSGALDDKRTGDTRFAALADFLESVPTTCPHDLFRREDDPKARASQAAPTWADASRIVVNSKHNTATETADLIIPAVGNNKLRHETLQPFMQSPSRSRSGSTTRTSRRSKRSIASS